MDDLSQQDTRLFLSMTVRNLLSFGPETPTLPLEGLNVLVGPNGSGKSNLLEAFSLLRNSPTDLRPVIAKGGGVGEWIWKGRPNDPATIDVALAPFAENQPLHHALSFRRENQTFRFDDELIETDFPVGSPNGKKFRYSYRQGSPIFIHSQRAGKPHEVKLDRATFDPSLSILAQRRDPRSFKEITYIAQAYSRIRLYREWAFGRRNTAFREPQKADLPNDSLDEEFSNLGLFLNRIRRSPSTKAALLSAFGDLYDGLTDFDVSIEGGTVQVFFAEGEFIIPATRLSDGSIRYLCLLAILCDPEPPPLIGIEEPELGLHPDLIPKLADLLVDASRRTQLIVTTHSDILVDALSERPSAVVVCEKHDGKTTMRRLDAGELAPWLEKYRLGQVWASGQIGGNRW